MARIVAAFGTSHSPALNSRVEDFAGHARRDELYQHHLDREGGKASYAQLLAKTDPGLVLEITPEKISGRIAACGRHIQRLAAATSSSAWSSRSSTSPTRASSRASAARATPSASSTGGCSRTT